MDRHLKAHLFDIETAIDEVFSFFVQVPKRFDEYQKNLMLRRAIERNIGIIGEATSNRVIHDYAAVTDDVMWKIVINDLPKLKEEVFALLSDGEEKG